VRHDGLVRRGELEVKQEIVGAIEAKVRQQTRRSHTEKKFGSPSLIRLVTLQKGKFRGGSGKGITPKGFVKQQ